MSIKQFWNLFKRKYSGSERRKFCRIERVAVIYSVLGENLEAVGFTRNIGPGGLSLDINRNIEKDTLLNLNMKLPGFKDSIEFRGKVVWNKGMTEAKKMNHEIGVSFINIKEEDRHKIFEYIVSTKTSKL